MTSNSYLVGKTSYNENGFVFADTPMIYKPVFYKKLTKSSTIHSTNSRETQNLWKNFKLFDTFQNVAYQVEYKLSRAI